MARTHGRDVRNVALVGHSTGKDDAGRPDAALAGVGYSSRLCRRGHQQPRLRRRRKAAQVHDLLESGALRLRRKSFTVVDTPGYPDFVGQAICACVRSKPQLSLSERRGGHRSHYPQSLGAAVRDEGLGGSSPSTNSTRKMSAFLSLIDSIQETFGKRCVLMNVPNGLGAELHRGHQHAQSPRATPGRKC